MTTRSLRRLVRLLTCAHHHRLRRGSGMLAVSQSSLSNWWFCSSWASTALLRRRAGCLQTCKLIRLRLGDFQDCGPRSTFRHIGQRHRKLVVHLDELIVFGVATVGPCLGCSENSRLMSFGIISLTANIFCASSIVLNWCSYSATFSDHAASLSFSSFASLHLLGVASMGCSAVAGSFDDLGA